MSSALKVPLRYRSVRRRAVEDGQHTYHGRPCRQCQTTERHLNTGKCVKCQAEGNTYYSRNTEDQKAKRRADMRRKWKERRVEHLWDMAKHRAKVKGLAFDIDLSDIVIPEVCPVLGIPMDSPSLDRHNNDLGYVKGNVKVISKRANHLKNNGKLHEFEKLVQYLRDNP